MAVTRLAELEIVIDIFSGPTVRLHLVIKDYVMLFFTHFVAGVLITENSPILKFLIHFI